MEFKPNIPIYLQVVDDITYKLLSGKIKLGDKLPSTRDLATMYKINPNTSARIYSELERNGICHTKRGLGTFINSNDNLLSDLRHNSSKQILREFVNSMQGIGYSNIEIAEQLQEFLNNQ